METTQLKKISGTFDVKMEPTEFSVESNSSNGFNRMLLNKAYHGDLKATGKGEMLSVRTPVETSAGYVALEQVAGELDGKKGSFVLQHFGVMSGGNNRLILEVVPDSGTGELKGLSGTMEIRIEEGQHYYDFEYQLRDETY
ncbi:DUF3224 domain-containing protein [Kangiella shandongensis]|uniref:DUF3224 domain-containing protein n=1 Tax=Kangiella shandongensis TaxID=2763258 RepID=UPI0038B3234C